MGMNLQKEAPNVVTTPVFHELIRNGYHAEVVCQSAGFKKASVWYAEWIVRVISPDGSVEKLVASTTLPSSGTEEIRIRTFKTANGLISFLHAAGFMYPTIPLVEGGRHVHILPKDAPAAVDDTDSLTE